MGHVLSLITLTYLLRSFKLPCVRLVSCVFLSPPTVNAFDCTLRNMNVSHYYILVITRRDSLSAYDWLDRLRPSVTPH